MRRLQGGHLGFEGTVGPGRLAPAFELGLDRSEVGQHELELEDAEVVQRVAPPDHVGVLEGPQYQAQRVRLAYAAEEPVARGPRR